MGNALRQMEEALATQDERITTLFDTKQDVGAPPDQAVLDMQARMMAELERHAAELAKLYSETTGRMDGLDEQKAERDWIEDLIAKIRRQVRGAQTTYFLYGAPKNYDHYGLSIFCMDKR